MFELYLMDLLPEKRKEFLEAHGCWDADVEDPSTFPNDWDVFPIMTFDPDELLDVDYCSDLVDDMSTDLSLEDMVDNLIEILVDNEIDDVEVMAEAIWDLFRPEPLTLPTELLFPSLKEK